MDQTQFETIFKTIQDNNSAQIQLLTEQLQNSNEEKKALMDALSKMSTSENVPFIPDASKIRRANYEKVVENFRKKSKS